MLVVSVLLSHGLVSLLRDSLMGHHPTELLDLYLRQDVVLNALEEGLVATDSTGSVVYANQAAARLFHVLPEKPEDPPSVPRTMGHSGQERTEPLWKDALSGISSRNPRQTGSSRPAHRPTTVPAPVRTKASGQ